MSVEEHKKQAPDQVRCMVVTVSDTRNKETDKSGKVIIDSLEKHGHVVEEYYVIQDDKKTIVDRLTYGCAHPSIDVIVTNGGTGIADRDVTIEAVQSVIAKEIPGFGELFRMLSYQEDIGAAAMLSRAIAGTAQHTAIFATPGSSGAVKLAMNRLILPELPHVVREINKDKASR